MNATNAVTKSIQRWRPTHHTHDIGDHQQYSTWNTRFSWQAHLNKENQSCNIYVTSDDSSLLLCAFKGIFFLTKGTHMEGKLSGKVVHAAGMHEAQGVSNRLGAQHMAARDWTNTPIGQCGSHDTSWLTVYLYGAQLDEKHITNTEFE